MLLRLPCRHFIGAPWLSALEGPAGDPQISSDLPNEHGQGQKQFGDNHDSSGLEPGLYINVQYGEASVVKPESGITTDQFIYHFTMPGQPVVFISHSNLVATGETVLTGT